MQQAVCRATSRVLCNRPCAVCPGLMTSTSSCPFIDLSSRKPTDAFEILSHTLPWAYDFTPWADDYLLLLPLPDASGQLKTWCLVTSRVVTLILWLFLSPPPANGPDSALTEFSTSFHIFLDPLAVSVPSTCNCAWA